MMMLMSKQPPATPHCPQPCMAGKRMLGNFLAMMTNSSRSMVPSPSLSPCFMMISAFLRTAASSLTMWFALRMLISSSWLMLPLWSSSNSTNVSCTRWSLSAPVKLFAARKNCFASTCSVYSCTKRSKMRCTSPVGSTPNTWMNSSNVSMPLFSWSRFWNFLTARCSSGTRMLFSSQNDCSSRRFSAFFFMSAARSACAIAAPGLGGGPPGGGGGRPRSLSSSNTKAGVVESRGGPSTQ
mmetsp:Transcript_26704/g.92769  ORF Transcript_26704/g.92769 Transcript_26704/m.92769 type:complete len:239 (-) Transcript_26704:58-774(-)